MEDSKKGLSVSRVEAGQKLLNFLKRRVNAPDGDLHRWIRTGQVRINGGRTKPFDHVAEGDIVRVPPFAVFRTMDSTPDAEHKVKPLYSGLPDIVYEDADILVMNKPAGLTVQGGTGHEDSVAARVARAFAHADFTPAPVHRLDKDTTGLLIFGKSYRSIRFLTDALAGRGGTPPRKDYLAWVEGLWPYPVQELRDLLVKDEATQRMIVCSAGSPGWQKMHAAEARLLAVPLVSRRIGSDEYTLMLLQLLTGRTHQIRVQLASRGHPVAGDTLYGSGGCAGLKLHAFHVCLPSLEEKALNLELPPPWTKDWYIDQNILSMINCSSQHVR
ncbi:MAG: RluA family pseudouridine synthase [Mailhella sp.]|nr:RluA family pseudouridine synthase [Mailhella sp.]